MRPGAPCQGGGCLLSGPNPPARLGMPLVVEFPGRWPAASVGVICGVFNGDPALNAGDTQGWFFLQRLGCFPVDARASLETTDIAPYAVDLLAAGQAAGGVSSGGSDPAQADRSPASISGWPGWRCLAASQGVGFRFVPCGGLATAGQTERRQRRPCVLAPCSMSMARGDQAVKGPQ